ncbi:MAG: metal ABC transporter substrate-binding protein [Leptolyngbya sp. DLM2.Bin15]|nr:MAG: metal ABC transporter substrate-binding protein [Leptolyngbya sp. DLM2.Bin15]
MKNHDKCGRVTAQGSRAAWGAIALVGLGLWGCGAEPVGEGESDRPRVVTTTTFLADWTQELGGDAIDLVPLMEPGVDPHVYEPVPADTVAIESADLIFYNGYDLEPGLIRIIEATGIDATVVPVAESVSPLDMEDEGQRVPDPHVWGDVSHAVTMVETMRDQLIALLPEERDRIQQNATNYITQLRSLDAWVTEQVATIPANQRQLVTTHDAFQYYARAYGLEVPGTLIGISTEEQPSAQTVQRLVDTIRALNVPAIFAETTLNPQLITTVAQEAGVPLAEQELYSDSLGAPGSRGDTYITMIEANTEAIVVNLGGQFTPFSP